MQDLTDLIREYSDYYFSQVHTTFPGVVVEYDSKKRRATIQPSLKRRAGNKEYIAFPMLIDVPVLYPGTKKYTIHIPLEKDDEVAVYFSERALEAWKDAGQDGIEDADPRRFNLSDAFCVPGLQPQEFIDVPEKGLTIKHKTAWDGNFISHVIMDDDRIEAKFKQKAQILIEDDKIECTTEENKVTIAGKNIDAESANPIGMKGTATQLGGGVLQVFWSDLIKAVTQYPIFIPPMPWPKYAPVPPVPPLINMALVGLTKEIAKAANKAKSNCSKALK